MKAKQGFTLVEILIVVVILGILAAIVIPQFTEASTDAKRSSLASDLQTVRSQIELYKIQHGDSLPTIDTAAGGTWTRMTERTNAAGTVMPSGGDPDDYPFGPYLQKVPTNPFNGDNTVANTAPSNGATIGWYFHATNGDFHAGQDTDLNDEIADSETSS